MREIDAIIDEKPTQQRVIDLAEARNRNIMAQRELQSFNDKGKWLNKHPLLSQYSIKTKFIEMHQKDPAGFLNEFAKTASYVSRYTSYLNNQNRPEEQHEKDKKNLDKYKEIQSIMLEVQEEKS